MVRERPLIGAPKSTYPRVTIVTEEIPLRAESEKEARRGFLWLLREKTTKGPFGQVSAIDIIALFPNGIMSVDARHRRLKECLMDGSDHVRKNRGEPRSLFSVTHFAALSTPATTSRKSLRSHSIFINTSRILLPQA